MTTAPILLFTYKRLNTLKKTVAALKQNSLAGNSDLFIFSDAAKYPEDKETVNQVRAYIKEISGFKSISIIEAKTNKGLANSIIGGVSDVIDNYGQVIVLEDDLITTPNFLFFMNTCLEKFKSSRQVFSISGYSFNLGENNKLKADVYFLNRGWSWGWATWKDRWQDVDWEVNSYPEFIKDSKAKRAFAKGGSDLNKMLEKQMHGNLDSWAIRWFYHQFHIGGLTVYPVLSKIYNEGFDRDATHTTGSGTRYLPLLDTVHKEIFIFPDTVAVTPYYQKKFQLKMGILSRIVSKIETVFKMVFSKKL